MCARCTSIESQSRRTREHVSRSLSSILVSTIPPTHSEATRLRDPPPSRGGSSLIITGILMASANGFTRELSSRLEDSPRLRPLCVALFLSLSLSLSLSLARVQRKSSQRRMMYRLAENVISGRVSPRDFGTRLPFQSLSVERSLFHATRCRRDDTKGASVRSSPATIRGERRK